MTESSLDQALMAYMNVSCYYKDLFTHKDINTYIMVKKKKMFPVNLLHILYEKYKIILLSFSNVDKCFLKRGEI